MDCFLVLLVFSMRFGAAGLSLGLTANANQDLAGPDERMNSLIVD